MSIPKEIRFRPGDKVADIDTGATPGFSGKKADAAPLQAERSERLAELQEMLFANNKAADDKRSVLLVLQGMDAAGKGGIVKHVVGAVNPMGVQYTAFGKPTEEELAHDYLWRIRRALPAAGHIGVFDRSHYEDVLVVRVNSLVPQEVWSARYDEINQFESELVASGTVVVKCFLHISPDEQKERLIARLKDPAKQWKYNPGDLDARSHWSAYREAYAAVLTTCSTPDAPWYVIPANRKWYRNWAISQLLLETLSDLKLAAPRPDYDAAAELSRITDADPLG
jgi:PPK2 family polyphosphate:nucleotide phosphotransferase